VRRLFLAGLVAMVALAGCVGSLHPLYRDQDLIFDTGLLGTWKEKPDSTESWRFSKSSDETYRLVVEDDGKIGTFEARLLKLGNLTFLDFYPEWFSGMDYYKSHFVRMHSFLLVRQITPTLEMANVEDDWMRDFLKAHPDALRHEWDDDDILLTAATADLQMFFRNHANDQGAFKDFSNLHKTQ